FIYAFIASRLPVHVLLQPRDYINSHQMFVAFALLALGVIIARPEIVAPAYQASPEGAPPIWPFLFVVIACGAISGFHSLVSSGTSSKQCYSEDDARFVGYGAMLTEGALSTFVIVACVAGVGIGMTTGGDTFTGLEAFTHHYSSWAAANGLGAKIDAFVQGAANMVGSYGIPKNITITIMGVFLVTFAATTLDTATRLQRYIVGEVGRAIKLPQIGEPTVATLIAVVTAFILAFYNGSGKGALTLWPLFGAANQLLGGLALLIITIYLVRKKIPNFYAAIPMVFMIIMTGWAMIINLQDFYNSSNWLLFFIGGCIILLEIWMIIEAIIYFRHPFEPAAEKTE
ncbi:MAG: carbon starvation protein A, partial [Desulfobacterales bacterium]